MKTYCWIISLLALSLLACSPQPTADTNQATASEATDPNPPAAGFDLEGSDSLAIAIADEVMEAMGGRKAWDETQTIQWTFFGRRALNWDKQNNKVGVTYLDSSFIANLDMNTGQGEVWLDGVQQTSKDSLDKYLRRTESIWINDSYWLVMPFKLKDSGVTLTYVGKDSTEAGQLADVLQLTFKGVGRTPGNKYWVYVDETSSLVTQWAFFQKATETTPNFVTPWEGYATYGNILLSGGRGKMGLSEIGVGGE